MAQTRHRTLHNVYQQKISTKDLEGHIVDANQ